MCFTMIVWSENSQKTDDTVVQLVGNSLALCEERSLWNDIRKKMNFGILQQIHIDDFVVTEYRM